MFRKKQTPPETRRIVQRQPSANVFSYYNRRSPSESPVRNKDSTTAVRSRETSLNWLKYSPSIVAGIAFLICSVYVSTLTVTPKVQTVGGGPQNTGLAQNTSVYEDGIQAMLSQSIFSRSKLLIDTNKLADEIGEMFPELGDISVIVPLVSRRPIVEVQPVKPALVMAANSDAYILDTDGKAIIKARDAESSIRDPLPTVEDQSSVPIEKGKAALPKEVVSFVSTLAFQLGQKQIAITSMTLPASVNELHVRLQGKPYTVKFDVRGEGRQQAGTLIVVKEKLEASGIMPAEYIDVRVPEKAFYK